MNIQSNVRIKDFPNFIETLIEQDMRAGYHSIAWNADSHSSGMYFVKMIVGNKISTQKLLLVK